MSGITYIDGQPYIVGQRCHGCRGTGLSQWTGIGAQRLHGPCRGTGVFFPPEVTEDWLPVGGEKDQRPIAIVYVPDPGAEVIEVVEQQSTRTTMTGRWVARVGDAWRWQESDGVHLTTHPTPIDADLQPGQCLIRAGTRTKGSDMTECRPRYPAKCDRCGHSSDWHTLRDEQNVGPNDPAARFKCYGHDPGDPLTVETCDCPDFVEPAVVK